MRIKQSITGVLVGAMVTMSGAMAFGQGAGSTGELRTKAEASATWWEWRGTDWDGARLPEATAYKVGVATPAPATATHTAARAGEAGGQSVIAYKTGHAAWVNERGTALMSQAPTEMQSAYVPSKPWLAR